MNQDAVVTPTCRSVFLKGTRDTTTERYTKVWITLINQIEKSKQVLAELR